LITVKTIIKKKNNDNNDNNELRNKLAAAADEVPSKPPQIYQIPAKIIVGSSNTHTSEIIKPKNLTIISGIMVMLRGLMVVPSWPHSWGIMGIKVAGVAILYHRIEALSILQVLVVELVVAGFAVLAPLAAGGIAGLLCASTATFMLAKERNKAKTKPNIISTLPTLVIFNFEIIFFIFNIFFLCFIHYNLAKTLGQLVISKFNNFLD